MSFSEPKSGIVTDKKQNRFPKGWNEARVQAVLKHYEAQTEEEAVAEDEAAFACEIKV